MKKDPNKPKKQPTGDYAAGYCRRPIQSRVKPGQVLNPKGINRKHERETDPFDKVRRRLSKVTIDGEVMMIPSDEAFYLLQMTRAMGGDKAAAKIVALELAARRKLGPPPPTAEEVAQEAAEQAERERLSAQLVNLLEQKAAMKRRGIERIRYGPDGQPISVE
jgi:hypothetical protein